MRLNNMKLYTLAPNEQWICDRFVKEWNAEHETFSDYEGKKERIVKISEFEPTYDYRQADKIWLLADWCWRRVDPQTLMRKPVIATVHHIVPDKFTEAAEKEFKNRDQFIDAYHVPCELTKKQIEGLTNKPIYSFPFWINQNIWFPKDKNELRKKYGIDENVFLIGSFQRDTEGHDLKSPKMEKGPDQFCDIVEALHKMQSSVQVLLGGWRRQYVMNRLDKAGIKYHYYELPDFSTLNDFYNMLDLYVVASRFEGGPQAVFESAATKTPIISTTVGYAKELLHEDCLIENSATWRKASNPETIEYNYEQVSKLFIPYGFEPFRKMIREVSK